MSFTHLHVHSEYSLLDGACRIEPMLDKIKSMGQSSVAITDHGVMYGVIDFYNAAVSRGIKPVIGCEVYVTPNSRFSKINGVDNKRYHLILLCENNNGYKNLTKIVSSGWIEGFYTKPRVDYEVLEKYHEGIIALSGCLFGEVSQKILDGDYEQAKEAALFYEKIFGKNNYFLEIQNHGLREQLTVNADLIKISAETGIELVATNDAHYIEKNDSKIQQVLMCIQTGKMLGDNIGMGFFEDELYLKSEEEMLAAFPGQKQAVYNSSVISDRCNVTFEFGKTKLPKFDVPEGYTHFEWFRLLCEKGLKEKYGSRPDDKYVERMNYELNIIDSMGYTDYYLIVRDFVIYAKQNGIPVGPGRGSGAASICAYCIGITGIDPMKYNLLFERFLNPERVSMPDFDIDFCYERRQEVIDYVINKYGPEYVAQIVTFGTLAAKAAVRDVGRVIGLDYGYVDAVAKMIPNELNITLNSALDSSEELKKVYSSDLKARELLDLSMRLEGIPRHTSTHAAGIVITDVPTVEYVPLSSNDGTTVTQYTMKSLEKLGLLKMDFLGLKTLTVIKETEKSIKKIDPNFDIDKININDSKVFSLLSSGETEGVFQFESNGMKRVLRQLSPDCIEDLIAVIALYRPGPVKSIPTYIENKKHPEKIVYGTSKLKSILDVTYGCIVYQEQVMQICREIAGYSYGRSDIVRRAMAKKQHDVMLKERTNFVYGIKDESGNYVCDGAVNRGVDEKIANDLFDRMVSFASYAFNKAHAASYAYVAYQTAFLKTYYPKQFFAALMSSYYENGSKIIEYTNECSRLGIKVIPPDVNISSDRFDVSEEGIIFSLAPIKNIGVGFIKRITAERTLNGRFKDFYDFCNRLKGRDFNKKAVENLIKCGAFDKLGANRHQLMISMEDIIQDISDEGKRNISGQIDFFHLTDGGSDMVAGYTFKNADEYPSEMLLNFEKEVSGVYLSGHPMASYNGLSKSLGCIQTNHLTGDNCVQNQKAKILGIITSVTKKQSKNNNTFAYVTVEDSYGEAEVILFSKAYESCSSILNVGSVLLFYGRTDITDEYKVKIICDTAELPPKNKEETKADKKTEYKGLFLRFGSDNSPQIKVCDNLLSIFEGGFPVYYYYENTKSYHKRKSTVISDVLIGELNNILGSSNVILKK